MESIRTMYRKLFNLIFRLILYMHSIVNADKLLVTKTTGILIQYNPAGSVIACSLNVTHSAECYTFSLKKMNRKKTHLQNQKRIYHNTHLPIEKYLGSHSYIPICVHPQHCCHAHVDTCTLHHWSCQRSDLKWPCPYAHISPNKLPLELSK